MIAQDMDPGAETRESLSQLATDRPGADHRKALRQLRERENGLIGEEACLGQSRNGRPMGTRARGDHSSAEAECCAGHLYGVRSGEDGLPQIDIDAKAPEPSHRIVRT